MPTPPILELQTKNRPSEEIKLVITSSSNRKLLILQWFFSGQDIDAFLVDKNYATKEELADRSVLPGALQKYFDEHVYNGDNQIKSTEEIRVGKYELSSGKVVDVYVRRSDGETKGNDPKEQARNKANALISKYKGRKNAILVGLDAVASTTTVKEPLGKPENLDQYQAVLEAIKQDPTSADHQMSTFIRWYLDSFYPEDVKMVHDNGIALVRTFNTSKRVLKSEQVVQLHAQLPANVREMLLLYLDCGGGGVFQQSIDWLSDRLEQYFADGAKPSFWSLLKPEQKRWMLYFQIVGVPIWAVLDAVDEMVVRELPQRKSSRKALQTASTV